MGVSRRKSVFYPRSTIEKARANAARSEWAAQSWQALADRAEPWVRMTDDELWNSMFGPTIRRSWMVWSNGICPACREPVTMYRWQMDPLTEPWKVCCPHCEERFPKNDFGAFYRSGLDVHGVFDPTLADRGLLYNVEHPDAGDPLYDFGVDDGEGYLEGEHRWRFIGAYLIYGQWKRFVHGGIVRLSSAYLATGDPVYAHKAGVLLDRVADLYPEFDFAEQGIVYERQGDAGYVSTWHDACRETRELALAYDRVVEALPDDRDLIAFLGEKARRYRLDNLKATWDDVQRNVEDRILRDALLDHDKIRSNYPQEEMTHLVIEAVLSWDADRERVYELLDELIAEAVAVDGVTGEKGLTGYATIGPRGVAETLGMLARADPGILQKVYQRFPRLHQTFRFHIDTWCGQMYYPTVADCGGFARPDEQYMGATFSRDPGLDPSTYTFFWELYQLTGDAAFVQVLYGANGNSVEGLPYDLLAEEEPASFQQEVQAVIDRVGTEIEVGSVHKSEWRLAILRSPTSALWLHYDAGGRHSHHDAMNLGLFAKGLDLMPDFGYPPVQYGGWRSVRATWYKRSVSHNTVVVDGRDNGLGEAKVTLLAEGEGFQAIRVSGAVLLDNRGPSRDLQFERTVALVEMSDQDAYVVDVFRVVGGTSHDKFFHSHFGTISVEGLDLRQAQACDYGGVMHGFQRDANSRPGWTVDWQIKDRYGLLPPGADVHLAYTDLTTGAEGWTAEGWVSLGQGWATTEAWIPRLIVRRQAEKAPLVSTFVAVVEPYAGSRKIAGIRRLPLETPDGERYPDGNVALEICLADGRRDLLVALDSENPLAFSPGWGEGRGAVQPEWGVRVEQELCWLRLNGDGSRENGWP